MLSRSLELMHIQSYLACIPNYRKTYLSRLQIFEIFTIVTAVRCRRQVLSFAQLFGHRFQTLDIGLVCVDLFFQTVVSGQQRLQSKAHCMTPGMKSTKRALALEHDAQGPSITYLSSDLVPSKVI